MSDLLEPILGLNTSSPILRLPLDVLHIIFDITRREPRSSTPFTLSHVCHEWRSFLFASPLLWTTIVIERFPLPNLKYYPLWLERSQGLDLSLHIQTPSLHWTKENLDTFVRLIIPLSSCCKEIEVTRPFSLLGMGFHAIRIWLTLGQFPKLTNFHMPLVDAPDVPGVTLRVSSMPNLESFEVPASLFYLSPEWFSACGRLRRLHLTYDDLVIPSVLLPSLQHVISSISAQLEDLSIHVSGHGDSLVETGFSGRPVHIAEMPNGVILLPRLTRLSLSWGKDNSRGSSFSSLFLLLHAPKLLALHNLWISTLAIQKGKVLNHYPSLEHLGITGHQYYELAASQVIRSSFNAIQLESLHSVEFNFIKWRNGEFATVFLHSCPQLVSLRLHQCVCVRETDLRRLVEGREASEDLAALCYLGVLNCKGLELNGEALAWFGGRLRTFEYVL